MKTALGLLSLLLVCLTVYASPPPPNSPGSYNYLVVRDPQKVADVVGRDLNVQNLGWIGHIGVFTGSDILEVLNETSVVQRNSIQTFKRASNYWGARGMDFTHVFMGPTDAQKRNNLVNIGWKQRLYSPRYTLTTSWQEGKKTMECVQWELTCGGNPCANGVCSNCGSFPNLPEKGACSKYTWTDDHAIFRCDTFVNFMFLQQTGNSLVTSFLPRNVYNALPQNRIKLVPMNP